MLYRIKIFFTLTFLLLSNNAFAEFGEKVNCQTTTYQYPVYAGYAQCYTMGHYIYQYVPPTVVSHTYISEWIDGVYHSCYASIPFSHNETGTAQTCDYKPVATASGRSINHTETNITATGRDFDGSIVNTKLWINGVLQSSTSVTRFWPEGTVLTIKAKTTDNDGYTHEHTRSYTVRFVNPCPQPWKCDDIH